MLQVNLFFAMISLLCGLSLLSYPWAAEWHVTLSVALAVLIHLNMFITSPLYNVTAHQF